MFSSYSDLKKKDLKIIAYNLNHPNCILASGQNQFTSASPVECSSLQEERKHFIFEIFFSIQTRKKNTNKNNQKNPKKTHQKQKIKYSRLFYTSSKQYYKQRVSREIRMLILIVFNILTFYK